MYRPVAVPAADAQFCPVPGAMPALAWIEIERLVMDDRYQRPLGRSNWGVIRKIAREFRWARFSPLMVCPAPPDPADRWSRYAIVDGQHRAHAAALAGIESVPCIINLADAAEQAACFVAVNGSVTRVTPLQVFRAAIVSRESWALEIAGVCKAADCRAMLSNASTGSKKPGQIFSIKVLRDCIKRFGGTSVIVALTALRRSEFGGEAAAWSSVYLRVWLVCVGERPWMAGRVADLAKFLDDASLYEIIDAAAQLARALRAAGETAETVYSMGVSLAGSALDKACPQRMALPGGVVSGIERVGPRNKALDPRNKSGDDAGGDDGASVGDDGAGDDGGGVS